MGRVGLRLLGLPAVPAPAVPAPAGTPCCASARQGSLLCLCLFVYGRTEKKCYRCRCSPARTQKKLKCLSLDCRTPKRCNICQATCARPVSGAGDHRHRSSGALLGGRARREANPAESRFTEKSEVSSGSDGSPGSARDDSWMLPVVVAVLCVSP